ncbi:MAG: hypothetical protein JKY51_02935, partial [Opitutaceae bacterium]|nr:hypothetical protein [Opitutaceae bacterium]
EKASVLKTLYGPRIYSESFTTALPSILTKGQWRLHLNPKLGDFFGKDYIRLRAGVSYSFSDYFEANIEGGTYFSNPFQGESRTGLSNIKLGAKYSWWDVKESGYNLSVAYSADFPLNDPPLELTDGYARFEPSFSVSREINENPATMLYLNVAYRFINDSPFNTNPVIPIPRNRFILRPGIIYYPGGKFRYGAELEYRTTALGSIRANPEFYTDYLGTPEYTLAFESIHEIIFSPSITWFPTEEIRKGFFIPGNWDLTLNLDIPIITETHENLGVALRFRWYYDYQKQINTQLKRLRIWSRDEEL